MLKRALLAVLFFTSLALSADDRAFLDAVSRPVLYDVPGTKNVRVQKDVIYRRQPQLAADVYLPPGNRKAPVVIFIHGGISSDTPIKPKDWGSYQSWGRLVAASGFVTVAFNHRLGYPAPHVREAAADLDQLIAYLRAHAADFGADRERICLMAFSAGGPLLSHALRDHPPYIRCIVSMYNFLDITHTLEHPKFEKPEVLQEFSPVTHLGPAIPPMLVVRAGHDQIPKLNESIATFVHRALQVNAPVTVIIHPTAPHAFETELDDRRTKEIIREVLDFLKWHLQV